MPRYREPFTIFPRKLKSGRIVWYYRTYSPSGERTVAHSTGMTNKTLARNYCAELLKNGMLYASTGITFGAYAADFYSDHSQWMADKIQSARGKERAVARKTIVLYRSYLDNKIMPFFKKYKLVDIHAGHVRKFRERLFEESLSNSSVNIICFCLGTIFSYAVSDRYITYNPCDSIKRLSIDARTRDSFSKEELVVIFRKKWGGDFRRKLCAIVSSLTGMRLSEIMAIRKDVIFRNYIDVNRQWDDRIKKLTPLKTGISRKVRIPERLSNILLDYISSEENGFIFTEHKLTYSNYFSSKINKEEKASRGLCFHSLRHFFNTYMLARNISEIKVKSIMGHSSGKGSMTERYANFRPEHFDDVAVIQDELLKEFLGN